MSYELRFEDSLQRLCVNGEYAGGLLDWDQITLCRELFVDVPVSAVHEIANPLRAEYPDDAPAITMNFSDQPARVFQGDDAVVGPQAILAFANGDVLAQVDIGSGEFDQDERWPEVEDLLSDWAAAQGYRFDEFTQNEWGPPASDVWTASFYVEQADVAIGTVLDFLESAAALVRSFASATYDSDVVKAVARAGLAIALIGVQETQTIEAKRSISLEQEANKLELAKDVAAMANSTSGGVIVLGAETKRVDGKDVIFKLHPLPDAQAQVRRIRSTIEANVYPVPDGLEVESVRVRGFKDELILISIPPQEAMIQPFIVSGVVLEGRIRSSLLSVPIRSGEDTRYLSKAAIHSALSVGRAVLNGQYKLALLSDSQPEPPGPAQPQR